jgi:hypothetical protein
MFDDLLNAAASLFGAANGFNQEFPGFGGGDMWNANAAMDQQFFNWAWQQSQAVARAMPNNVSSAEIIGAMQPHTTGAVYGQMNAAWHQNQQRQSEAMDHFSRQMRDQAVYVNPVTGERYVLPLHPGGYHQSPAGWFHAGQHPTDVNRNFHDES